MPRSPSASGPAVVLVLALVLLSACARGGATAPETERVEEVPSGSGVATWTGDDLLPAAGGMTRVGEIGVYFAVDVFRYTVVALEVRTGRELWRRPVEQQGRIRGVVQQPTVDPVSGLVLASTSQDDEPHVTAFDLRTGAQRWSSPSPWARTTPRLCGTSSVCLLGADGTVQTRAVADGSLRATGQSLGVDLGGAGGLMVTSDPDRDLVELGRLDDDGYHVVWRHDVAELTGAPGVYSSDGGWRVWVDESTGSSVVSLGARPVPGDRDGTSAAAQEPAVGWATAFLDPAGGVLDRATGSLPCFDLPVTADAVPLCRVVESRSGDGAEDLLSRTVDQVQVRTSAGVPVWVRDLPTPADLDDVTASATPDTVALPVPGGRLVLDRRTGEPAPPGDDELALCTPAMPEEDVMVGLTASNGQIVRYLRAEPGDLALPCTLTGELLPVADLLAAGRVLPVGVGPSDPAPGAPASAADAWVVTMTPTGVLAGAGPRP